MNEDFKEIQKMQKRLNILKGLEDVLLIFAVIALGFIIYNNIALSHKISPIEQTCININGDYYCKVSIYDTRDKVIEPSQSISEERKNMV